MKTLTTSIALIAAGAFSASAAALDTVDHTGDAVLSQGNGVNISWQAIGEANPFGPRNTVVYSDMAGGGTSGNNYGSFGLTTGNIPAGTEDYTTFDTLGFTMKIFRFIGGVGAAGHVAWFDFYDSLSVYYDSFGVQFPVGGAYLWTITITNPMAITGTGFAVGYADIFGFAPGSTFEWYLSAAAPTIGTNNPAFGSGSGFGYSHNFEMETPAPGALALLGLAGLAARRRRR